MAFDPSLFESFLSLLPHDRDAAIALAKRHDWHIKGPAWLKSDGHQPIRHALEIRHESFRSPIFIDMLRRHKVALVCADTVKWPLLMDITADFVYCRLHGSEKLYVSGYEDEALDIWAQRIRAWATGGEPENATRVLPPVPARTKGRDVYLYFDNTDVKLRALSTPITWPKGLPISCQVPRRKPHELLMPMSLLRKSLSLKRQAAY